MAQLQHWIVTCTTCDSPAEYHCNTCGDILCPRCRDIHQRSRGTGHHSIVPYAERVEPGKLTGQCNDHPGLEWILWCQNCDKAVCTECVASPAHKGHSFDKIAAKLVDQRKAMQEEFDSFSKLLKTWENSLEQNQSHSKAYDRDIDEISKDITRAADRVCLQVRNIEATLQAKLKEIRTSKLIVLQNEILTLKKGIEKIKQHINKVEDKLRSEDTGVLLHFKVTEDRGKRVTPSDKEPPPLPVFIPGLLDIQRLEAMIGSLSVSKEFFDKKETDTSAKAVSPELGKLVATSFHKELPQKSPTTSDVHLSNASLLPGANVRSTIQTSTAWRPYIACTGLGNTWVITDRNILQLMDENGVVKETTSTGLQIQGLAVTPQGDPLISNDINFSIRSIAGRKLKTLFKTEWEPSGLCCLQSGDILVTFYYSGRVVKYSTDGTIVKEYDKSLFRHPRSAAQNRINNYIYVCDKSAKSNNAFGKILALEEFTSKEVYEYTGSDKTMFSPIDVCTDQAGRVIITDYASHRIHILDQHGKFLQYMMTQDQGLHMPFCIDIDRDGFAWVSEWNPGLSSQVKILKYTN